MDCLFCKIIDGEIPSTKVFENEYVYAFRDINPQMPVHIVIVPRKHMESCNDVNAENASYLSEIFKAIPEIAKAEGLKNGYRVISNCGPDACQSVKHLHFHILGGAQMSERMG